MNVFGLLGTLDARLGFTTPSTGVLKTRFLSYLNQTQLEILSKKGLSKLRRHLIQIASVANSPYGTISPAVSRIVAITDRVNNWELVPVPLAEIRQGDPGLSMSSSFPDRYAIINLSAAAVIPYNVSGVVLQAVSSSAADVAPTSVNIEGIKVGHYHSGAVALTGTTPVSLGATAWNAVTKLYIGGTAGAPVTTVGAVTVTVVADGFVVAVIGAGRSYSRFSLVHFYPIPTAANTYYADVELHLESMANGADEPLLPEEFHWLLVSGALMKEYERNRWHTQYLEEREIFRGGVAELQVAVSRRTFGSSSQPRRFSQLGPYFPAGT